MNKKKNKTDPKNSDFKDAIILNREPNGSSIDGLAANKVVDAIYKANKLNKPISIN